MIYSQAISITSVSIDPGFNGATVELDQGAQVLFKRKMPLVRGTKKVNVTEISNMFSYRQHRYSPIVGLAKNRGLPEQCRKKGDSVAFNIAMI